MNNVVWTRIKPLRRVSAVLIAFYGLLLIGGCAWQRKMLYFPTRFSTQESERRAQNAGFEVWCDASGAAMGWRLRAATQAQASVLIVHGNAGCALDRGYLAQPIHAAGEFDVHVLEYPGYGAREGEPNMESWLAAGESALAALPHDRPVYIVSESIGAGVAAHLARFAPERVAGLVMIVPYDDLASVAHAHMPFLLPRLILRDRYQPAEWLRGSTQPIHFVVAELDAVIPAERGRALFDSYAGPKRLTVVEGAGHNDVASRAVTWWRAEVDFLAANAAQVR